MEYIFYTIEGFTQDPAGNEIENCQLIGIASGDNENEAKLNLLKENPWVKDHGYDEGKFIGKELATN